MQSKYNYFKYQNIMGKYFNKNNKPRSDIHPSGVLYLLSPP
mgnify:CR=1 FL=1